MVWTDGAAAAVEVMLEIEKWVLELHLSYSVM